MKKLLTTLLFVFSLFSIGGCTKDPTNTNFQLPPETQTGANTFGVTINGKVYIPRDPSGSGIFPNSKGMIFWGTSSLAWNEIEIKDGASPVGFNMIIHLQNFEALGAGTFILKQSNFHNNIDSSPVDHIYFKIWDSNISNYAYYGSIANQGQVNVTRRSNGIVSGNFKGKFVRYDNPNQFIQIADGRFDINTTTLPNTIFP